MTAAFPTSFDLIGPWAAAASVSVIEARVRFAQYAVLLGISNVRPLREGLVFRGGNALDFVWQPNRSTVDLDFSVDAAGELSTPDADTIKTLLQRGATIAANRLGILLAVHGVTPNPRGTERDFVTFQVGVGYALLDEPRLRQRMARGEPSPRVIRLDISLNEPICDAPMKQVDSELRLRVATKEDIVAEQLRALLQQPIRNRQRRQDLLDITVIMSRQPGFDRRRVFRFLLEKAKARDVVVTRSAFHHAEVGRRARIGYDELEITTRALFIGFDEALALLYALVADLDIPPL